MIGLYVHLPFCHRKCAYCAFYSECNRNSDMEAYVARLIQEANTYASVPVETIYFGGGTPTSLPAPLLIKLLTALRAHFPCKGEITIEANPATVTRNTLKMLRGAGFNRISIGVQSLSDDSLRCLGRLHTAKDALETIYDAKKAGFTNISADIMFGLPNEKESVLYETARQMLALPISHISAYSLSVEPGTQFSKMQLALPDEETERRMYWSLVDMFTDAGYQHYEISNFALPGMEAKHNTLYWTGDQYIGIGAGAHSYFDGNRYANVADITAYLKNENTIVYSEPVDDCALRDEYYMLGLRLMRGVRDLRNPKVPLLISQGLLYRDHDFIRLTRRGTDLFNYVVCELCTEETL